MQAGRAEVRGVIERARERLRSGGRRTIFFLDEIHRFNKAQQDALLPAVEEGLVTLIGATTENPYFEVNSALLSRARVYELEPLTPAHVRVLLDRAVARGECGPAAQVDPAALEFLADAVRRRRPDGAERARARVPDGRSGRPASRSQHAEDALQRRALLYDRQADRHYDTISAWIKATRGSDPDASLYYLAVMLEGGEDPRFIVRRMVVLASEDIGNADPQALVGGDRGGRRGRARRHARGSVRAGAGGDLPVARAEVRCGQARGDRFPRVHPRARRGGPAAVAALVHAQRRGLRQSRIAGRGTSRRRS